MKKIILSITAVTAMAAAALPAVASAQSFSHRQDRLEWRIEQGQRSGALTRHEARHLKRELRELRETQRLEDHYRRDGLSRWERADLDRRFDRINAQIRYERHDRDRDYGYGYGRDHDRPHRW